MKKLSFISILIVMVSVGIVAYSAKPVVATGMWSSGTFTVGGKQDEVPHIDSQDCKNQQVTVVGVGAFAENVSLCVYERPNWKYALYTKQIDGWYSTYYEHYFVVSVGSDKNMYVVNGMDGRQKPIEVPGSNDILINGESGRYAYSRILVVIKDFPSKLRPDLSGPGLTRRFTLASDSLRHFITSPSGKMIYSEAVGVSQNGQWVVVETMDGLILVSTQNSEIRWFSNLRLAREYPGSGLVSLAVSNNGKYVAMLGYNVDPKIYTLEDSCVIRDTSYSDDLIAKTKLAASCPDDAGRLAAAIQKQYPTGIVRLLKGGIFNYDGSVLYIVETLTGKTDYDMPLWSNGYINDSKIDYLALGDSFSSGEGDIKPRDDGRSHYLSMTDVSADPSKGIPEEKCHISDRSYPFLLTQDFGVQDFESVACSGAVIGDLGPSLSGGYKGQDNSVRKPRLQEMGQADIDDYQRIGLNEFIPGRIQQIEFVKKYKPKAITLTAGGNDAEFATILSACATSKMQDCGYAQSGSEDNKKLGSDIRKQFNNLVYLYRALRSASPDTKIYVVGYPVFINSDGLVVCALNAGWTSGEERRLYSEATKYMNTIVQAAAQYVGVKYLNVQDSLVGHRMCDTYPSDTYVTGVASHLWVGINDNNRSSLFHPNHLGHERIAQAIKTSLGGATFETYNYTETPDASVDAPPYPDYFKDSAGYDKNTQNISLVEGNVIKQEPKQITISPYMFMANSTVDIEVHSNPTLLGSAHVESDGSLNAPITIPESIPVGYHTLVVKGQTYSGEPIEYHQIVLVWGNDSNDRDEDGIKDDIDKCMLIPQANVDVDQDGIDDACDPDITEPPQPKEPYRVRQGDTTRQYNGAPEKANYLYVERNTKASSTTGITGDADPDKDGWAIVGASRGSIWGIPDVGPSANFVIQGEGSSTKPYVYVRTSNFGCVSYAPASLEKVMSEGRTLSIVALNTTNCRTETPESDNDQNGIADNAQPLYMARNGDMAKGEDPRRIYLLRSFHGAEAQLMRSDYSYRNDWNRLAVTPSTKDAITFNKLVLLDSGNGKSLPLVFAKNQKGKCVAYVPLWTGTVTSFSQSINPLVKLITLPKGQYCD